MSAFLFDTLLWTGVLIAAVLLVRRPVARTLGSRAAYALWALPMLRLLLPPLVLPAWMAPTAPVEADLLAVPVEAATTLAEPAMPVAEPVAAMPLIALETLLLTIWLAGAAIFLVRRYSLYFRMRRELLARARPVGETRDVRLVETPDTDGPVAFGVIDKVVALPEGFMAAQDRTARDMAISHELAHHRGRDLLCNMIVQPLFAVHWFNPLSVMGWNALRRDQEAACDARVIASCPHEGRAAYAAVIARFATSSPRAPRLVLAAPMACPVLGDRSIIHRLKALAMNDISERRRWAGRLALGATALALPLTASVSYAQVDPPAAPPAPEVPAAAEAPIPPVPPAAPSAWTDEKGTIHDIDAELSRTMQGKDGRNRIVRVERNVDDNGKVTERRYVVKHGYAMTAEERAEFEKDMAEMRKELHEELGEHGEMQRELRKEFAKDGRFHKEMRLAIANAHNSTPRVKVACRTGQREVTESITGKDGREELWVCQAAALAEARAAIAEARAEIAAESQISARERAEALRALDEAGRKTRAD